MTRLLAPHTVAGQRRILTGFPQHECNWLQQVTLTVTTAGTITYPRLVWFQKRSRSRSVWGHNAVLIPSTSARTGYFPLCPQPRNLRAWSSDSSRFLANEVDQGLYNRPAHFALTDHRRHTGLRPLPSQR